VLVFAPYYQPGFASAADFVVFAGVVLALSAALVVLVIARLRRVIVADSGRQQKPARVWIPELKRIFPSWPSPTLDGNPVLWREWHRNRPSKLGRRFWAVLLVICWMMVAWGTYETMIDSQGQPSRGVTSGYVLMLIFGLLMLSATAPTSLAEERVRGSLDVLLATPLSTRSIVIAKWWGTYRQVLVLLIMPLYVAVFLAVSVPDVPAWAVKITIPNVPQPLTDRDRVLAVVYCLADFLASGALLVSLGLALATWVRQLGRAVVLSVIAFFVLAIGWSLLVEFAYYQVVRAQSLEAFNKYSWLRDTASSFSPLAGPMRPIDTLMGVEYRERSLIWIGTGIVILIKAAIAGLLLWLTIKTFDRCLGRVPGATYQIRGPQPLMSKRQARSGDDLPIGL
jgi:ABC-type transport system involved in multi-copper enzyme maturation permease subunit